MNPRFRRFKNDLRTGWAKVRQGTADATDRSLREIELLRLKGGGVLDDKEIQRLFEQVDRLKQEEARIRFERDQIKEQ